MTSGSRRQRYDLALNSQGLVLARDPQNPVLEALQESSFYLRYNQGDHNYNDLSKYWYMAQTDWSGGFKDDLVWADDSKFYGASNIDAFSFVGAFKLAPAQALLQSFSQTIQCGVEGFVNNSLTQYIGSDNTVSRGIVFQNIANVWTDISSVSFTTAVQSVNQLLVRSNNLWSLNFSSSSAAWICGYWNGAAWVDPSSHINATGVAGGGGIDVPCGVAASSGKLFLFVTNPANNRWGLVSTSKNSPTVDGDWTKLLEVDPAPTFPVAAAEYKSNIYYLMNDGELRVYDPSSSSDTSVTKFSNNNLSQTQSTNLLKVLNNLLHIVCATEVWTYDAFTLTRLYRIDDTKNSFSSVSSIIAQLQFGGAVGNNRLYLGNLVIVPQADGSEALFNFITESENTNATYFLPLFADSSNNLYGLDSAIRTGLYKIPASNPTYKSGTGKNYIIFSNYDKISGVDKLGYFVTVIFDKLVFGQKITAEYTTDNLITTLTTWTTIDTIDFNNVQDQNITQKNLYFPTPLLYKKIWVRYKLDSNGTNTPVVYDHALAYKPWPDRKLEWHFTVKCINELIRKDQTREPKTGLWLRNYLRQSWRQKAVLTFEDYDADTETVLTDNPLSATATTVDVYNTDSFPETGRILIETEEIFYSGKTKTSFLNCTRGYNNTNAVSHALNTAVTLGYRVFIDDYTENLVIANDPTQSEYLVRLILKEV